jgi:hypothetical protein
MRMSKGGNCYVTQWCNLGYSNCVIMFVFAMVLITNDAMTYFEYHPKCIEAWTLGSSVSGITLDGHFVFASICCLEGPRYDCAGGWFRL